MSLDNPVQFAVVREDPLVEKQLVEKFRPSHALLIGGGGCTAFTLASLFPELKLTLVDPNLAQLQLIARKSKTLQRMGTDLAIMNIGSDNPQGLNACGNFETLFHCLREFWGSFILRKDDLMQIFDSEKLLRAMTATLTSHRYWPVSFDLFFSDEMLTTMFGNAAVQHAPKGSYPSYFRRAVEEGLKRPDALENPYLHHLVLGYYLQNRPHAWPLHLQRPPRTFEAKTIHAPILEVPSFADYQLVGLSNIFDWSTEKEVRAVAERLDNELPTGGVVLWRQLNNETQFEKHFERVNFDHSVADDLLAKDRSLFYMKMKVGVKA